MTERFSTITVENIGPVARLTLARPERANALNAVMLGEIGRALDEIERDAGLRVVIVRGAGAAFSSGFDLKEQMERRPSGVEAWRTILRHDFDTIMDNTAPAAPIMAVMPWLSCNGRRAQYRAVRNWSVTS